MPDAPRATAVGWSRLFVPVALFLAAFGLLNFAELPFGWKDRRQQFGRYLEATLDLGPDWIMPVLWLVKLGELTLGLIAVVALTRRSTRWLAAAVIGWMAVFTAFSVMDIWAADRVELQEHTVYFVMFTVLLVLLFAVSAAERFRVILERPLSPPPTNE
ncbi:hypothetical protein ACQPW3_30795 [Actinosynnema sp. CA-248983]